jgi:hypothetical protein
MKLGAPLVSRGPVSRSLVETCLPCVQRIHRIWNNDPWCPAHPTVRPVDVEAPVVEDPAPSSHAVSRLGPWGSHPILDPLWSTGSTRITADRVDVTRLEKVDAMTAHAAHAALLDNLRGCWMQQRNCGTCQKCVRTIVALQSLGKYEPGHPFDRPPLTAREIARLDLRDPAMPTTSRRSPTTSTEPVG